MHEKIEKDLMQAAQVIDILLKERPGDMLVVWDKIKGRKSWVKRVSSGLGMMEKQYPSVRRELKALLKGV